VLVPTGNKHDIIGIIKVFKLGGKLSPDVFSFPECGFSPNPGCSNDEKEP
jgi:hypothetical protein